VQRLHQNACFVYDSPKGDQTNKSILEGYKGDRGNLTREKAAIFKATKALLRASGRRYASHPFYEADQLIGTYALHLYEKGEEVKIVACDKDFNQLVKRQGLYIYDPLKHSVRTYEDIVNRYEVRPEQFAMYLTLLGDKIDSVPGLVGCGPKTAVELVKRFKKYSIARKEIFKVEKPKKVEKAFQDNIELLDKCFKVVKLGKIEGIESPPEPEPYSTAKIKRICEKYELNYSYLVDNLKQKF
jgi:DNA polymerase-1